MGLHGVTQSIGFLPKVAVAHFEEFWLAVVTSNSEFR
jgi:hypothetical protein